MNKDLWVEVQFDIFPKIASSVWDSYIPRKSIFVWIATRRFVFSSCMCLRRVARQMTLLVQSCKRGVFLSIFSNRISPSLMESFATNLIASHLKMEWADFHRNSQKKCQLVHVLLLELLIVFFFSLLCELAVHFLILLTINQTEGNNLDQKLDIHSFSPIENN